MREPKKDATEVDLTIPLNKAALTKQGCFGKEWDVTANECRVCADRDVCGILFKDVVDAKAEEHEAATGSTFLDKSDYNFTDEERAAIVAKIESGVTTAKELKSFIMEAANSSDETAGILNTKRFVKSEPSVYTKDGVVWIR